ncbi:MAG: hypothetical protein JWP89_2357 [Schlesneria sp.]|nr:hypothetical protein [Schlesneria sp.]
MTCAIALVISSLLCGGPPAEIWPPGFVGGLNDGKRLERLFAEIETADFAVRVKDNDQLDINILKKTFTLDELQRFFKFQRHKEFIVICYDKNAPDGSLKEFNNKLKDYFRDAGYKRILLTHGHSSGVIIHEDYRPELPKKDD